MKIFLITFSLILLTACQPNSSAVDDPSAVLVTVGDKEVTAMYVNAYLLNRGIKNPSQVQMEQGLEEVIKQQSLLLQAEKEGLELSTEQKLSIQQFKDQAMAQLAMQNYMSNNPISEEAIKAEYDRIVAELKGVEYKVRHMLYQDEVQALMALDEINAGASYLSKEKEYLASMGPVKNVGDLGWVNIKQVPEPFHKPLQTMESNQVHDKIVITKFGAHILYLEDKRSSAPPVFDEVKAGIKKSLEQKAAERFEQLAKVKAKVRVQK
ncbi:peptidylprolyl isomerase [Marinicella litoralis]|uniref:peptidylprolyl isomerase n=1 Tax=Marinicella litoralis TaxID=644220 RepID=A0A4R6XPC1_9GAMM|nr:peptidylprolyl isomerase [Marinicella litoralis]TDR19607.1 peptidyl-prolyl cis-trans isomerase C [Marinicella litoralis]